MASFFAGYGPHEQPLLNRAGRGRPPLPGWQWGARLSAVDTLGRKAWRPGIGACALLMVHPTVAQSGGWGTRYHMCTLPYLNRDDGAR